MTKSPESFATALQAAQLFVLVAAVITAIVAIGRRDAQIEYNMGNLQELKIITTELTAASIRSSLTDTYQTEQLERLLKRVERLESSDG